MNAITQTGDLPTGCVDYTSTLRYWKEVEEKYQQKKRQWMETNARMISAKLASIRARKETDRSKRVTGRGGMSDTGQGESPESEDDYDDARDEEFSDVDNDMFLDPADRYYSSLDEESWNKIRLEIMMKIHQYESEKRKRFIRRILLSILILFLLLVGVLYFMYQVSTQVVRTDPPTERPVACVFQCDQKTMVDELVQIVFPPVNIDEEGQQLLEDKYFRSNLIKKR